jgi:hypothetical protein
MANPDRDTMYNTDGTKRTVYTRDSGSSTGWFVGIIVALALLAIAYLVFSANSQPSTNTTVNNTPAVTTPATPAAPADNGLNAPAAGNDNGATTTSPMTTAPATGASAGGASTVTSTPAASAPATASSAPAPASSAAQ